MKQLVFENRVWVKGEGTVLDKVIIGASSVYCLLTAFRAWIGTDALHLRDYAMLAVCAMAFFRSVRAVRNTGYYTNAACTMEFSDGLWVWVHRFPPEAVRTGEKKLVYRIRREDVREVQISHELGMLRLCAKPWMHFSWWNGRQKETEAGKQEVVLTAAYDPDVLKGLVETYTGLQVQVMD